MAGESVLANIGVALIRGVYRSMPPRVEILGPKQGAGYDNEPYLSWLHVAVELVKPRFWEKKEAHRCTVKLKLFEESGAQYDLRWQTREGPKAEISLDFGRAYLVPVVMRNSHTGQTILTDESYFTQSTNIMTLNPQRKYYFKIDVSWGDVVRAQSDYFAISVPPSSIDNGFFSMEREPEIGMTAMPDAPTNLAIARTDIYHVPYDEWQHWPEMDLPTAAAIWSGSWDTGNVHRHVAFRNLKFAIRKGDLEASHLDDGKVNIKARVRSNDLKTFFERWEEIKSQYRQIHDPRLELSLLRTRGVELRNGAALKPDTVFCTEVAEWLEQTASEIENIDAADSEWFRTLDAVPMPRVAPPESLTANASKCFRELDYMLVKLDSLIVKYGTR